MKNVIKNIFLIATIGVLSVGCKKFLDINTDEDTPQNPDPTSVFPTQLAAIPRGIQYDARYLGKYIQNWLTGANNNQNAFDLHGYAAGSDAQGDIWRMVYYGLGKNLEYVIDESERTERWDVAGAGLALKAFAFQTGTDYHGDMGFYGLYKDDQVFYKYQSQDTIYRAVDSLCKRAIDFLSRAPKETGLPTLKRGDFVYDGNVTKWKRFAYGILARNRHHLTNKPGLYNADSVMFFCDNALADINGSDDFLVPFSASKNDDANFFGPYRGNLGDGTAPFVPYRQSNFIVRLLDGTTLKGNTVPASRDPRLRHMLSASQDTANGNGGYRGVDPGSGDPFSATTTGANARRRVAALWGDSIYVNPSSGVFSSAGKYLFKDKAVFPVMTYAEIQFIKAEAAFRSGDKAKALIAYRNGILAHMRFINRDLFPLGNDRLYNNTKITDQEIDFYMNNSGNVKTTAATLTLSDIMLQKYIALWGWGFVETWVDLRRYDYNVVTDPDNANQPVYRGFRLPTTFASTNLGKPVERVRPRFNSEYVWNIPELQRIGALNANYHTLPMWFSEP